MTGNSPPREPARGLAVGLGLRPGTGAGLILRVIRECLGDSVIDCLATLDRRAGEAGVRTAAEELGVPLVGFDAEALAAVEVPHPGERIRSAVGTGSVAEAAAVLAAGGGRLVLAKRVLDGIVIAAATDPRAQPEAGSGRAR